MAEVATKKSINVVSSKKSEVCSVQSNNGLIQLDNITSSNKQLISLCDNNDDEDDLILTNNTRNELDTDDKSLQELIESELALRICSSTEEETGIEMDEQQETTNEPETVKRIVLDRQQDALDVNTEFIAAETEHSALVEKPYSYQNGHMSPETKISDSSYEANVKPESIDTGFRDEPEAQAFDEQPEVGSAIAIEETTTREIDQLARAPSDDEKIFPKDQDNEEPCPDPVLRISEAAERLPEVQTTAQEPFESPFEPDEVQLTATSATYVDEYQREKEVQVTILEASTESTDTEEKVNVGPTEESNSQSKDIIDTWTEQTTYAEDQQAGQFSDNFDQSYQEDAEVLEEFAKETEPEEEIRDTPTMQSRSFDEGTLSHSESSIEAASTQEFLDMERRVLSEENYEQYPPRDDIQARETLTTAEKADPRIRNLLDEDEEAQGKEEEAKEEANDNVDEQNAITESSSELSVSEPTFIEKTEVVISETSVKIVSETQCLEIDNDVEPVDEDLQLRNHELESPARAPLATPDDETSDVSNAGDIKGYAEIRKSFLQSSNFRRHELAGLERNWYHKEIEGTRGRKVEDRQVSRVSGRWFHATVKLVFRLTNSGDKNALSRLLLSDGIDSNEEESACHGAGGRSIKAKERVTSKAQCNRGSRSIFDEELPANPETLLAAGSAWYLSFCYSNTVCSPRVSPGHPYAANRLPVSGGSGQSRKSSVSPRFPPAVHALESTKFPEPGWPPPNVARHLRSRGTSCPSNISIIRSRLDQDDLRSAAPGSEICESESEASELESLAQGYERSCLFPFTVTILFFIGFAGHATFLFPILFTVLEGAGRAPGACEKGDRRAREGNLEDRRRILIRRRGHGPGNVAA
ncbi:hypothetical protein WN48_10565 [Eufriesea mexicana]|uniref:Uncharacterized protein n=1 Tax=Eufriesea mexicana TaxID=516756 RepID=A0A310SE44_9HYME|nr:hypothetical protein WN48_10565 [Eufriesea mexicana]